ncbi:MAG: hypothetical protein VB048_09150 [Bacteroidaceae bacterium]|nr:hypothetical protein [Bacteroidaceae bacterium]
MAAPFSFIAFIYKTDPNSFNILKLPGTLSILITLVGFIGVFLSFIIIESGMDSVLYARSVNGIRKYFVENGILINIKQYIVLPIDTNTPVYLKLGELFWITIITGMINSFYIALAMPQIDVIRAYYEDIILQKPVSITLFVVLMIIHIAYYVSASIVKNKKYGRAE